jgi:NAD(P)H-dependent FMN reductase
MTPLTLPVFSCSLDPGSRSRLLAQKTADQLTNLGHDALLVDLAAAGLPTFDNKSVFESPAFAHLHETIRASDGIVLAVPIYNWSVGSAAKNLVEATGATGEDGRESAWFDKVVTFVCAAGLPHSYMATASFASSLMLDFKCIINPYTGYVTDRDWADAEILSAERTEHLATTLDVHVQLSGLLRGRTYASTWSV